MRPNLYVRTATHKDSWRQDSANETQQDELPGETETDASWTRTSELAEAEAE